MRLASSTANDGSMKGVRVTLASTSIDNARRALARFAAARGADDDGLLPAALLALGDEPEDARTRRLAQAYLAQQPSHGRDNPRRYPWSLGFRAEVGHTAYAEPAARQAWWRPREARFLAEHPGTYARRILVPVALATQLEFWTRASRSSDSTLAASAAELLDRTQPIADGDVARWIAGDDPWADTFALWVMTGYPGAHSQLRDLVFALAIRYARIATRYGVVPGIRHPFYAEPLASATAHLAASLWRLGIYPSRQPGLLAFVAGQRRPDGGWADPDQPSDVLTTLAAADLLSSLDPTFDPAPTIAFFERQQEPGGWWRALNPEVPWLTGAIAEWLTRAERPFPERFSWPDLPVWARDRTTGLPARAVFDELCVALSGIPGLANAPLEAAFIDLANFGDINNTYGQDAGDEVLAEYAAALTRLPGTLAIRIGGDELLLLGTPHTPGALEPLLRGFMDDWVEAAATAGVPRANVLPRIVMAAGRGAQLRSLFGHLGTEIGFVKEVHREPQPPGVLVWLPDERTDD